MQMVTSGPKKQPKKPSSAWRVLKAIVIALVLGAATFAAVVAIGTFGLGMVFTNTMLLAVGGVIGAIALIGIVVGSLPPSKKSVKVKAQGSQAKKSAKSKKKSRRAAEPLSQAEQEQIQEFQKLLTELHEEPASEQEEQEDLVPRAQGEEDMPSPSISSKVAAHLRQLWDIERNAAKTRADSPFAQCFKMLFSNTELLMLPSADIMGNMLLPKYIKQAKPHLVALITHELQSETEQADKIKVMGWYINKAFELSNIELLETICNQWPALAADYLNTHIENTAHNRELAYRENTKYATEGWTPFMVLLDQYALGLSVQGLERLLGITYGAAKDTPVIDLKKGRHIPEEEPQAGRSPYSAVEVLAKKGTEDEEHRQAFWSLAQCLAQKTGYGVTDIMQPFQGWVEQQETAASSLAAVEDSEAEEPAASVQVTVGLEGDDQEIFRKLRLVKTHSARMGYSYKTDIPKQIQNEFADIYLKTLVFTPALIQEMQKQSKLDAGLDGTKNEKALPLAALMKKTLVLQSEVNQGLFINNLNALYEGFKSNLGDLEEIVDRRLLAASLVNTPDNNEDCIAAIEQLIEIQYEIDAKGEKQRAAQFKRAVGIEPRETQAWHFIYEALQAQNYDLVTRLIELYPSVKLERLFFDMVIGNGWDVTEEVRRAQMECLLALQNAQNDNIITQGCIAEVFENLVYNSANPGVLFDESQQDARMEKARLLYNHALKDSMHDTQWREGEMSLMTGKMEQFDTWCEQHPVVSQVARPRT